MGNDRIKIIWMNILSLYSSDQSFIEHSWSTITRLYSSKSRHYHSLSHIAHILSLAEKFRSTINHYEDFVLSIVYHDVIYKVLRKDNELKSAEFMKHDLEQFRVRPQTIDRCYRQIVQTQKHQLTEESELDDALFLDMDLEVLSWDWDNYLRYTEQIRKEYWMYPQTMYNRGRKMAMQGFMNRPAIYFTEYFRTNHETRARENIQRELDMLSV